MFDESKICPYTGLRPFTEDESIYFKGRDEHIEQATRQLEKNKFIMLTGASGDGKSSLVYAGIIPNAKAGFLKASFSNWAVADFRPERSPLVNLSRSLAAQLNVKEDTVKTELSYGFSALIDIYKASSLYYDNRSAEWLSDDDKTRTDKRRKAANLIILADQFEEFYTNPENFHKGVPSQEAMSVTNLLLETARIALEENLPVYIIITMRSDFIGQCAAFRGLPEYIGFSQFFVPRLNRKELREVIEEPASLSGNRINRRLTERLINDTIDGTDQLPILQHALNQIWKMADEGGTEMDLLHYAMVGGMAGDELSKEDAETFRKWFRALPEKIQSCYNRPGLQNVLNTHANKLYNQAADSVKAVMNESLSDEEAKRIIQMTFKCLTKIDNGRAVRNRMTLGEVTAIINDPQLDFNKVGNVLGIFRQPGNTLLRPYADEIEVLKEGDILDITHESLIRNWNNLKTWADEEFSSYTISIDFGRQLNRWTESNKSDDFLLYIGPLTYFESWINKVRPNAAWVARYMKEDLDSAEKLEKAKQIQINANLFLKRSARKHLITRTVIRYGPKRIAAVLGAIVLLALSSFVLKNYLVRRNSFVLNNIKETTLQKIVANPQVALRNRTGLVTEEMRLGEMQVSEVVSSVSDPIERINVVTSVATQLIYQGATHAPEREILQSLTASDSLLSAYPITDANMSHVSLVFKEMNDLRETLELGYFYNPSPAIDSLRKRHAKRSAAWVVHILRDKPAEFTDIANLNVAMEHAINKKAFSIAQIDEIIAQLSPFENTPESPWVSSNYSRDKVSSKGFNAYGFRFNGRYQELAYLYGVKGNAEKALQAIDTLLQYNQNYFQNDYTAMPDNAAHIAACFYRYGKLDELDKFVLGYCQRKKITEADFYEHLLARCKLYEFATTALDLDPQYDLQFNLGLEYSDDKLLDFFFTKYRDVLNATVKDPNVLSFQLALSYKDEGIIHLRKLEVAGLDSLGKPYQALFDKALSLYRTVDPAYLNEEIPMVELSGTDRMIQARKFLFLYPDVRTPFHPNEPRLYHYFFVSGCFLQYILDHNLFEELYHEGPELHYFETFMRDYHFVERQIAYTASKKMSYKLLASLEKKLAALHADRHANLAYLYLYLGHFAAEDNDGEQSAKYFAKLTRESVKALFLNSLNPSFTFQLVHQAASDLVKFNHEQEAEKIIKGFDYPINRSTLYACVAHNLLDQGINDGRTDHLIDSAKKEIERTKGLIGFQTNRVQVAFALALRNRPGDLPDAYKIIKNVEFKFNGIELICRGLARNGDLFEASRNVPENLSDGDAFSFAWKMVVGYEDFLMPQGRPQWNEFADNRLWTLINPINYINEN